MIKETIKCCIQGCQCIVENLLHLTKNSSQQLFEIEADTDLNIWQLESSPCQQTTNDFFEVEIQLSTDNQTPNISNTASQLGTSAVVCTKIVGGASEAVWEISKCHQVFL